VVGIQPHDVKDFIKKKSMHSTVFVGGQLELPSLAIGKLASKAEAVWLGCLVPFVVVTTKTFPVGCSHFLPSEFADMFQAVKEFGEICRLAVYVLEFTVVCLQVFERKTNPCWCQRRGFHVRWLLQSRWFDFTVFAHACFVLASLR
jgi:hypothetical protein